MSSAPGFAEQLEAILSGYVEEVTEVVKEQVDATAEEVNSAIKSKAPRRYGKYIRAFALKTTFENKYGKSKLWHVKPPHYRLTHVLEHGHVNRDGTRTEPIPHIIYGEQIALQLKQRIERGIQDIDT